MSTDFDIQRIELMDDASVEAMKRLGGPGRLQMLNDLTMAGRLLMAARVKEQNPTWSSEQVAAEVARRLRDAAA
ncbi:MAG: hypothetical protein KF678_02330 [Phycisphaeraceae bacterium]|nr:hypothetical protein [Phycisphaeraceae bacterium]